MYYLKESKYHLSQKELNELIIKTLALPRFKLAHEYYENNPGNWDAANLLRKADPDEYMKYINSSKKSIKEELMKIIKAIAKRI